MWEHEERGMTCCVEEAVMFAQAERSGIEERRNSVGIGMAKPCMYVWQ